MYVYMVVCGSETARVTCNTMLCGCPPNTCASLVYYSIPMDGFVELHYLNSFIFNFYRSWLIVWAADFALRV